MADQGLFGPFGDEAVATLIAVVSAFLTWAATTYFTRARPTRISCVEHVRTSLVQLREEGLGKPSSNTTERTFNTSGCQSWNCGTREGK